MQLRDKRMNTVQFKPLVIQFIFVIASLLFISTADAVVFVAADASGDNNGTSWAHAYTNLQTAITNTSDGEIWVKWGTYVPNSAPNYANTPPMGVEYYHFHLKNGLALYGGFAGNESSLDEREIGSYPTILSGANTRNNIIYHDSLLATYDVDSTAVIDGFTFTGATSSAMILKGSSPTIRNCTFRNNSSFAGAAINAAPPLGENIHVDNSTFYDNTATKVGGAIYSNGMSGSKVVLTNCTFANNSSGNGGAIYSSYTGSEVMNSTFIGNTALNGRALYNTFGTADTLVTNSILWNGGVSEIYNEFGSTINVTFSVVQGGEYVTDGNTGDDPVLDENGLQDNGGPVMTIAIDQTGSAYNGATVTGAPLTDARGVSRGMNPDIGAYEISVCALQIIITGKGAGTVTSSPSGINSCSADCLAEFPDGQQVTLTAVADEKNTFVGWSGTDCTGTGTCDVILDQDKEVTAIFAPNFSWNIFMPTILNSAKQAPDSQVR